MVNKKVTPEMEKFIQDNCTLSPDAVSSLILKKFKIKITGRALAPHVKAARAEAEAVNNAKIQALRAEILDHPDKWANKYLQYLNDEVEALRLLIDNADADGIQIKSSKDRIAISQAFLKSLCTVLDFVKPMENPEINVNFKPDLSKLTDEELRYLESIKHKLEGDLGGQGTA
jgi:hypothetical protein